MDILKDEAGYHKIKINSDESGFPCTRTLLDILGFKDIQEKDTKLPEVVLKFIPGTHYVWQSDKYSSPIVAATNPDGEEYGFFWAASKSEEAIKQLQEIAKQAVSIYLGYYSKDWVKTIGRYNERRIDFDLVEKQTKQDLVKVLPA
jgi:hypothetical protein